MLLGIFIFFCPSTKQPGFTKCISMWRGDTSLRPVYTMPINLGSPQVKAKPGSPKVKLVVGECSVIANLG